MDFAAGFLRRRYLIILVCLLLSLPFGAWSHFTAPPSYTASTTMMIETRKSPLQSLLGETVPDPGWIESQIGVLKSQNVAAYVVKQLRLAEDPGFVRSNPGLLDKLRDRLGWGSPQPKSDAARTGEAVAELTSHLDVRRVGQSLMMNIDYRSSNPEQAVKIANAVIDGYIFDQLNAKYQSNRRAGDWLQERLQALREQAAAAERAVIEFKAKNNIVKTGGTLMSDKQLSDLAGQLATTRARSADLKARIDRIEVVRQDYQQDQPASAVDEDVSEAMNSGIITKLRTQYLDLVNREADWSVRYGKTHAAVVNLRNQMRDIRKSIRDELGRIEETSKSEYEIATKREGELEKGLSTLVSQSTDSNQAQVALFSLESAAQSYRKLYDSFLQQYTESVQQQSYPISDARSLSSASVTQTGPKRLQAWMLTIFAGGMLGFGIGALREIMDRGFRTCEQVRSLLETDCLGMVPLLNGSSKAPMLDLESAKALSVHGADLSLAVARRPVPQGIGAVPGMLWAAAAAPSSPYAEAMRAIKVTLDLNGKSESTKVLGLTSSLPHEGKSSVSMGMATLVAQSGARTILVDCDVRNPSISRALAPDARVGFLDVVAGTASFANAVLHDPNTKLDFLPMVANPALPNAIEMLASDAARALFATLKLKYEYVIVDLAPLVAAVDVRATLRFIDSYLLVIEWGVTKIDAVKYAIRHAPGLQGRVVGAVLNKVDMAKIHRYDSQGAGYYYGRNGYQGSPS
jgi:succinoglycan biosynthesis transport protein ExoP